MGIQMKYTNAVIKKETPYMKSHWHEGTVRFVHKKKSTHIQFTRNRKMKRKKPQSTNNKNQIKNSQKRIKNSCRFVINSNAVLRLLVQVLAFYCTGGCSSTAFSVFLRDIFFVF